MRPVLFLSNWSSHSTPGHHGPGEPLCAMRHPRDHEQGGGLVKAVRPSGTELTAVKNGSISIGDYFDGYRGQLQWMLRNEKLRPGKLTAHSIGSEFPVKDQDTLCCACARPGSPDRTHPCHLEPLAEVLVLAGWDVVIYGKRLTNQNGEAVYMDTKKTYVWPIPEQQQSLF